MRAPRWSTGDEHDNFLPSTVNRKSIWKVIVNGRWAELSVDRDALRWTDITQNISAGLLATCLSDPPSFTPHVAPFDSILCALHLDRAVSVGDATGQLPGPAHRLFSLKLYSFRRSLSNRAEWLPWRITLQSPSEEDIDKIREVIDNGVAEASASRPRRLLVLLNPNAGNGAARPLYHSILKPVFSRGGVEVKAVETTHAGHAIDLVRETLLAEESIDGIVAVGGDGIFHEALHGLMMARMSAGADLKTFLSRLRLAHVPCGSTDAVACSLNGTRSVFSSAMHIALGDSTPLDILRVRIGNVDRFACCIATYGFMGDVVHASERHRWLGPMRYDLIGAAMLLYNQSYCCKVSYLPSDTLSDAKEAPYRSEAEQTDGITCRMGCPVCAASRSARQEARTSESAPANAWKVLEDEWMSIMLIVMPCRSGKTPHGMARHGHLANGQFTLVLVRKCSPPRYLQFLATMSSYGLIPGQFPGVVEVLDVAACTVEGPAGGKPTSRWNIDGELVDGSYMRAEIMGSAVQCFARGVET